MNILFDNFPNIKKILEILKVESIFDIINNFTKSEFIDLFQKNNLTLGVNPDLLYNLMYSLGSQLHNKLLERDSKFCAMSMTNNVTNINFTNYKALFCEPWEKYCHPTSIEATTSTISYLVSIYKIALLIEKNSGASAIKLIDRRPDLNEIILDEKNTFKEITTISLVNEILEKGIDRHLKTDQNNNNDYIWKTFAENTYYPFQFPFNLQFEKIKSALQYKSSDFEELNRTIYLDDYIINKNLHEVNISLSTEQINLLLDISIKKLKNFYNATSLKDFKNLDNLIEKIKKHYNIDYVTKLVISENSKEKLNDINNSINELAFLSDGINQISAAEDLVNINFIELTNTSNKSALDYANESGNQETIKLINDYIELKRIVADGIEKVDGNGNNPLMRATWENQSLGILLLKNGANVNFIRNSDKHTPLMHVAGRNNLELIKLLLEKGADPTVKNTSNKSALDYANESGNQETIKLINDYIELKRIVADGIEKVDGNGNNPLMRATWENQSLGILLLKNGANVNFIRNSDKHTPLMHVAGRTNLELIKLLLEKSIKLINFDLMFKIKPNKDKIQAIKTKYNISSKEELITLQNLTKDAIEIDSLIEEQKTIHKINSLNELNDVNDSVKKVTKYYSHLSSVADLESKKYLIDQLYPLYNAKSFDELNSLNTFCERTELKTSEVEELLFLGKYKKHLSDNYKLKDQSNTSYIYFKTTDQNPIEILEDSESGNKTLSNLSPERLNRIQKMIRLKKWLNLSFWETHLLLTNLTITQENQDITQSVLQSIGYFVHLKEKYSLKVEDYISWIKVIPITSVDNKLSWFDSIFNSNSANSALLIEDIEFDFNQTEGKDAEIVRTLIGSLKISPSNFQSVISTIFKNKGSFLKANLEDISLLYRVINIPRVFGLSSIEGFVACEILGYSIDQLQNHEVIYHMEIFCDWLKEIQISPIILKFLITNPTTIKSNSKEVLDFANTANAQIEILNNQSKGSSQSSEAQVPVEKEKAEKKLMEQINQLVYSLIEKTYKISVDQILLIFRWLGISLDDFINKTITQKTTKTLEELDIQYSMLHFNIARYSTIINILDLNNKGLQTFLDNPGLFELSNSDLTLQSFYTLWVYTQLIKLSADQKNPLANTEEDLLNILSDTNQPNFGIENFAEPAKKLARLLNWNKKEIFAVVDKFGVIDSILKIHLLVRLKNLSEKTTLSSNVLLRINTLHTNSSSFDLYDSAVKESIYSYPDDLEKIKRDALVAFYLKKLIPNNSSFSKLAQYIKTPNNLYEYLLIDNQVSTEVITTPIASAIASLQQFINGVALNIEPDQHPQDTVLEEWESNNEEYAIWAANMEIQNYPENYIEPSLRLNKSEYFKELESSLSQANISEEALQKAVLGYLNRFEQISDYSVLSGYVNDIEIIATSSSSRIVRKQLYLNDLSFKWTTIKNGDDAPIIQNVYFDMVADYDPDASKPFTINCNFSIHEPSNYNYDAMFLFLKNSKGDTIGSFFSEDNKSTQVLDRNFTFYANLTLEEAEKITITIYIGYKGFYLFSRMNQQFKNIYEAEFSLTPGMIVVGTTSEFNLSSSKCYFLSKSRQEPREYYVRLLNMSNSIDGTPNPWAWNDYQKIELPLGGNIIESTLQPVYFNKRLYIMWGEWNNKSETQGEKEIRLDVLELKIGYQSFDGTWSAPQTLISVVAKKAEFPFVKAVAIQIENEVDSSKKCVFTLCKTGPDYGKTTGAFGFMIDKNFNIQKICTGSTVIPDAIDINNIQDLKDVFNIYRPKMLQMKLKQSPQTNFTLEQILKITIENYKDTGDLGTAQFLSFDPKKSTFKPVRLNTTFVKTLVGQASLDINNLLTWKTQTHLEPSFGANQPKLIMDFKGANGRYFYELFFHVPFLIATRLKGEQKYKEAKQWLRLIFDPAAKVKNDGSQPYWNVRPLIEKGHPSQRLNRPADVDAIAASNPVHYQKAVFYLYIDTIISEADDNYRLLTPDGLVRAKQLYIQALSLLGQSPDINITNRWEQIKLEKATKSTNSKLRLMEKALLNNDTASVERNNLGNLLTESINYIETGKNATLQSFDNDLFRIPLNKKLLGYWDTVEARLDNLRHNRGIDGKILSLSIFASPMNPKDLLNARGSGGGSALSIARLSVKVPPLRYSSVMNSAHSAVDTLTSFGEKLLGYLEKNDEIAEQELDQTNVIELGRFAVNLQDQSIKIMEEELKSIFISKVAAQQEYDYYRDLYDKNLIEDERQAFDMMSISKGMKIGLTIAETIGEGADIVPNIFGLAGGGMKYSAIPKALAVAMEGAISILDDLTEIKEKNATYERRRQEWEFQAKQAKTALEDIDQTIEIQKAQIKSATYALESIKREQTLMQEKYTFLRKRFTNKELYQWLIGQMTTIYFQVYDAAIYLCLAAEACYRFESGNFNIHYIQTGGWNNVYKGLCVGEQLKLNLHQMEAARVNSFELHPEVKKNIKISELFEKSEWPKILEKLKKNGEIQFEFPERMFAEDHPGHYCRQIYFIMVKIIGDQENQDEDEDIHAILTQTSNSIVIAEDNDTIDYLFKESSKVPSSESLVTNIRSGQQIILSQIEKETGVYGFEFDTSMFSQEQYTPFHYVGVISKWHLKFTNEEKRVDFLKRITDINIKVRYTSIPGSPQFTEYVKSKLKK